MRHSEPLRVVLGPVQTGLILRLSQYRRRASDISPEMISVVKEKAKAAGLAIPTRRQDFRHLTPWPGIEFDAVVCSGGSLTLLATEEDILLALRSMTALAARSAGVVLIGHRNYAYERDHGNEFLLRRPYSASRGDIAFDVRQV